MLCWTFQFSERSNEGNEKRLGIRGGKVDRRKELISKGKYNLNAARNDATKLYTARLLTLRLSSRLFCLHVLLRSSLRLPSTISLAPFSYVATIPL